MWPRAKKTEWRTYKSYTHRLRWTQFVRLEPPARRRLRACRGAERSPRGRRPKLGWNRPVLDCALGEHTTISDMSIDIVNEQHYLSPENLSLIQTLDVQKRGPVMRGPLTNYAPPRDIPNRACSGSVTGKNRLVLVVAEETHCC